MEHPNIPTFLRRETHPRYLVADDGTLIITLRDQTIPLDRHDIERLRNFVNRFDQEGDHHADAH
jgi:hypothetical protein